MLTMGLKVVGVLVLVIYLSAVFVLVVRISSSYNDDDQDEHQKKDQNQKADSNAESFVLESPEELLGLILHMNSQQRIYNENLYTSTIELVIVVQVHKRPLYLQQLVKSLEKTPSINKTLLIFSHDLIDQTVDDIIQKIKFAKVLQIFYPLSIQTHPEDFPGPGVDDCVTTEGMMVDDCPNLHFKDSHGNFRNSSIAQIKHHWWWKANFVFKEVKILQDYHGLILFVEEDHYLTPDFAHCLSLMKKTSKHYCPNCWFYTLGISNKVNFVLYSSWVGIRSTVENLGLAFNRTIWNKVSRFREYFCKFDDYNWDWSLQNFFENTPGGKSSMVMLASRVYHIGSCGTHSNDDICDPMEVVREFENRQVNLFPDSLYVTYDDETIFGKNQGNGGWGDPRDQELCMKM